LAIASGESLPDACKVVRREIRNNNEFTNKFIVARFLYFSCIIFSRGKKNLNISDSIINYEVSRKYFRKLELTEILYANREIIKYVKLTTRR